MIRIEVAGPSDLSAVRACAEAAYAGYIPVIGRRPAPMDADFAGLIASRAVHVARDASGVAGFVVYVRRCDHMLLESVGVDPVAQGRGIGRALVAHCEVAAEREGLQSVRLYTNARMSANLRLYPRLGYRETERRQEDEFDRVYFQKDLP
ncbi:GNAT family N-acetyltransferase [Jannaschia sp. S6380]|uniref:GNAT family N-acetyltransferase n=1 Tax=Jannaschia sp. S6380 TaxID=2926408 RepID=UPI001FF63B40|nr:GNAT family N-acetyltransferase [Jannaschia sp. S6380]MCK0167085.1 GNAT family N-acetyltransferase [Jannaschia sp. S6380]